MINPAPQQPDPAPQKATPPVQSDGSALLARLKRMGVTGWHEPLLCLPKGYEDFSLIASMKDMAPQKDIVAPDRIYRLTVVETAVIVPYPKKRLILNATDGSLPVKLIVFVNPDTDTAAWKKLAIGEVFHISGALQNWSGRLQFTGPTLLDDDVVGKILPVYEGRRGVVSKGAIFDATRFALKHHLDDTVKHLIQSFDGLSEQDILDGARLKTTSLAPVLLAAHAPQSGDEGRRGLMGMRRLAAFQIVENARRMKQRDPVPESVVEIPAALLNEFATRLPYPLTGDQRAAIKEIVADMASPLPMRRVLSGDVGCGKTLCIIIPALATQRLGKLAVILTPNALLAAQFVDECKLHFGAEINVQAVTAASRKTLDLTDNPILVGTTALLSRLKGMPAPAFLAVDEEQKMSVGQKAELTGTQSNYLQATATPIPRTTALISHGAMDVSIIREIPVAKAINTAIVKADERQRLYEHTRKVVDAGGQVAIVYPIVDDEDWPPVAPAPRTIETPSVRRDSVQEDKNVVTRSVPLSKLRVAPLNERRYRTLDRIHEIKQSLASEGQLEPITVYPGKGDDAGYLMVYSGETRHIAAGLLGWETIVATIRYDIDPDDKLSILRASHRHNDSAKASDLDHAEIVHELLEDGITQLEIANVLGYKSEGTITKLKSLLDLPSPLHDLAKQYPNRFSYNLADLCKKAIPSLDEQTVTSITEEGLRQNHSRSEIDRRLQIEVRQRTKRAAAKRPRAKNKLSVDFISKEKTLGAFNFLQTQNGEGTLQLKLTLAWEKAKMYRDRFEEFSRQIARELAEDGDA